MKSAVSSCLRPLWSVIVFGSFAMIATPNAKAAVNLGTGSANGLSVGASVNILETGLLTLDVGPVAAISQSASTPFNIDGGVLFVDAETPLLGSVGTDVITTTAVSNVDGSAGPKSVTSSAVVDSLNINLLGTIVGEDIMTLGASTVSSTSTTAGDFGSLVTIGTSQIEGLTISIFGDVITIPVDAGATANFVLFDELGIRIVLNEQIATGDGTSDAGLTVNAIRITLSDVEGLGTGVDADIIVGQSFSSLNAIPEPSLSILMGGSLSLLLLTGRRRITN